MRARGAVHVFMSPSWQSWCLLQSSWISGNVGKKWGNFTTSCPFLSSSLPGHHWRQRVSGQINKCGQAWPGSVNQPAHLGPTIQWLLVFVELSISNHPPGPPSQLAHQLAIICHTVAAFTHYLWNQISGPSHLVSLTLMYFDTWNTHGSKHYWLLSPTVLMEDVMLEDINRTARSDNLPPVLSSLTLKSQSPKDHRYTWRSWNEICFDPRRAECQLCLYKLMTHFLSSSSQSSQWNLGQISLPFSGTRASGIPVYSGQDFLLDPEGDSPSHSSRNMVSVLNPVIK